MSRDRCVAVIGAGPAGLAAALALADAGARVVLLDGAERPGGHPLDYGCVATDRCASCSACLVLDAARRASELPAIELLAPARVTGYRPTESGGVLTLEGREERVDGVIVATGHRPADLATARTEYGHGRVVGVSTVTELEARYRDGSLAERPPRDLAFIQCAGSRDRAIGRDYCSRVCCTYALRLARAIHHRVPEIRITVFYQDLTPSARGFEALVRECEGFVRFVRALPAKVYQEVGGVRPIVCYADTLAGPDAPGAEEPFSEVALSVGMWPGPHDDLDEALGLTRDEWGFVTGSRLPRVRAAGSCTGPMSIAEATADGRAAAADALETGACARKPVAVAAAEPRLAELVRAAGFESVEATAVEGVAGALRATTAGGPVEVSGVLGCTFVTPSPEATGLPAHVRNLWSEKALQRAAGAKSIVLMPDLFAPWSRLAHEVALRLAAGRSGGKVRTWYLMRHAFTGEQGLEQLLARAREAGTVFTVCPEAPTVTAEGVEFVDRSLGRTLRAKADVVLAAAALRPAPETLDRLRALGLLGPNALEGSSLPHEGLSRTARLGYHLAGWLRDATASEEQAEREVREALTDLALPDPPGTAEVDADRCAICLTCIRSCPHEAPRAVHSEMRDRQVSYIRPEACVGCGICVSACPAEAITLGARTGDAVLAAMEGHDG